MLHVLYLIFNEGYASTSGPELHRAELASRRSGWPACSAALLPDDGEVAGLLALMLLTDARRPARAGPDGELIPMAEQDRTLWNADQSPRAWRSSPARFPGPDAAVPAPGGDRGRSRRSAERRGDRLAADRGAVRAADALPTTRWWP